jgi:hypothetical protein
VPPQKPKRNTALIIAIVIVGIVFACGLLGVVGSVLVPLETEPESSAAAEADNDKYGPCGQLTVELSSAGDEGKLAECEACCDKKQPKHKAYYYHFWNDQPPGRCRCRTTSELPSDCTKAKDMALCAMCCQRDGKNIKAFEGGKSGTRCTCQ